MLKRFEHGGNIYQAHDGRNWMDFSANINPLGMADTVRSAIISHVDAVIHYPDPQGRLLKEQLCFHYGVSMDQLVLGNGAAELFYVYMHCYRPSRVVIPVPSFNEYERAALSVGADVTYCFMKQEDGFTLPVEEVCRQCSEADCILIGNPNNPTGTLTSSEQLETLLRAAKKTGTDIIVDESFLDFREDADMYTVRSLASAYNNLFIVQSLTKFYAIPGLRLGFAIVPSARREQLEQHKDVWNVNCLAQYAGIAALKDTQYQEMTRQYVRHAAIDLYEKVQSIQGLHPIAPSVNFMLIDASSTGLSAAAIGEALRNHGILIRDCANYPGLNPFYFRIAVRRDEENKILYYRLKHSVYNEN